MDQIFIANGLLLMFAFFMVMVIAWAIPVRLWIEAISAGGSFAHLQILPNSSLFNPVKLNQQSTPRSWPGPAGRQFTKRRARTLRIRPIPQMAETREEPP